MDPEQYTVFYLAKVFVGAALVANFALPLYTVVRNRELWDEPMAVIAGHLSFACMVIGLTSTLIGIYDLTSLNVDSLCAILLYNSGSLVFASKVAFVSMALDKFVAVVRPLHYYQTMQQARPYLIAVMYLVWAANMTAGITANMLDWKTHAEKTADGHNASLGYYGCRWETACAEVMVDAGEAQLLILSMVTAGLLVYTGVIGHRTAAKLMQEQRNLSAGDQKFLDNYRAFKKILIVLSLTVTLDIIGPTLRFMGRWYPMPKLMGFIMRARMLAIIAEGWAYGLSNVKLRAAYRRTLCGRPNRAIHVAEELAQHGQQWRILNIVCRKPCNGDREETVREAQVIHPAVPATQGAGSNRGHGLEMARVNED